MCRIAHFGLICAAVATGLLMPVSGKAHDGAGARTRPHPSLAICAGWEKAANQAIAQLARGEPNVNLQQISDAIAGMRRARRLCELGWPRFACIEYDAIIRGIPSRLQIGTVPQMCQSVALDPPGS